VPLTTSRRSCPSETSCARVARTEALITGRPVDQFADEVGVAAVPCVLLDQVDVDPAKVDGSRSPPGRRTSSPRSWPRASSSDVSHACSKLGHDLIQRRAVELGPFGLTLIRSAVVLGDVVPGEACVEQICSTKRHVSKVCRGATSTRSLRDADRDPRRRARTLSSARSLGRRPARLQLLSFVAGQMWLRSLESGISSTQRPYPTGAVALALVRIDC